MPLAPELTEFTTTSPKLVNYDWTDVIAGVGYVNYYPVETENGKELAITQSIYATNGKEYTSATNTTYDEDFDLTIDKPFDLEGDVLITIPVWFHNSKSSSYLDIASTITVKIRHYDGTTETDLATGSVTATANVPGSPTGSDYDRDYMYSFSLSVPKTHFSKDDILRYTISGTSTGDAQLHLRIYRDPAARVFDDEMDTSKTTIAIPMKIED